MSEPLMRLLAELPSAEPNPVRAERIRRTCRARLAKPTRRAPKRRQIEVWRPLVACLGLAYLTEVIVLALLA